MVLASTLLSIISVAYAANDTYTMNSSAPAASEDAVATPIANMSSSIVPQNSSSSAAPIYNYNVTTTERVVDTVHVPCSGPTTVTTNGQTYTVTEATTLTITDCPCTIHEKITRTETTCPEYEATSSSSASQTIDAVASEPEHNTTTTVQNRKTVTVPCSEATEVTHGGSVITVTAPTTLTLTDCPEATSSPKVDAEASTPVSTPSTTYSTLTEKLTLTTRIVRTVAYNNDKSSTLTGSDVCEPVTVTVTEYNNGPAPSSSVVTPPKSIKGVASSSIAKGNNNSAPVVSGVSNSTSAPSLSNGSNKVQIGGLTAAAAVCISAFLL